MITPTRDGQDSGVVQEKADSRPATAKVAVGWGGTIANYKDGYWDGFDSRDDESGDGNHDDVMLEWF